MTNSVVSGGPHEASVEPERTLRAESEAMLAALAAGALGAVVGFILSTVWPGPPLAVDDGWSFGASAALGASVVAIAASIIGYWRSRRLPGQEWRQKLSPWLFSVNTVSVVVVHTVLTALAVVAVYLVFSRGFVGLAVGTFWAVVLMALTLGLTAYAVYLSVSRMTAQRMSSLLLTFITVGTLTAMVTAPDPDWWRTHFSHLGTFWSLSGVMFNGTLIAGGLLVTTFAVYIGDDMRALVARGALRQAGAPRFVATLFVVMGIMLACVGIFPVHIAMLLHNLSASGMAVMFIVLLVAGFRMLRGMPRAYFLANAEFLAALVVTVVLFLIGYFTLTALEIIVFALIFGWITVFIRFLGVTGQAGEIGPERRAR